MHRCKRTRILFRHYWAKKTPNGNRQAHWIKVQGLHGGSGDEQIYLSERTAYSEVAETTVLTESYVGNKF